jgi:hypothetical protein
MPVIVTDLLLFSCLSVCVPWIVIAIALYSVNCQCSSDRRENFGVPSNLAPGFGLPPTLGRCLFADASPAVVKSLPGLRLTLSPPGPSRL